MAQDPYSTVFTSVSALDDAARRTMASLYLDVYDGTSETLFLHDLSKKDEALLVFSGPQLVGFTTLLVFEREWRSERIRVVYSGDTVVDRAHWGQQALAFDWIARIGEIKRERPEVPLYWLLLVKGHRTYRYLPLFGKSFHPHWSNDRSDLKSLADALATEMFPDDYNPATGVVEFRESRGHLKSDIALPPPSDLDRQEVSFFLQRNPGFQRGHELVCVCEVEAHNMKPLTLELFQKECGRLARSGEASPPRRGFSETSARRLAPSETPSFRPTPNTSGRDTHREQTGTSRIQRAWLQTLLARNGGTSYLRQYGSPRTIEAFRDNVPIVSYDDLLPWLARVRAGESDALFAGRPVAYERTSGSSGAAKLIPYSAEGLHDFQRSVLPWLTDVMKRYEITGSAYFSISPATRPRELIGDVPVGLPDGAYLGDAGARALAQMTAVPFEVAAITDVARWRDETLRHLAAARDLELISVWSPTFLLQLLDQFDHPQDLWPRLKVVSCWASGASRPFAEEVATRLPHAHLQPKGLMSTETVITVPDAGDRPALTPHGFFEFVREGQVYLSHELRAGDVYEVLATTASGLYRYRTADLVLYDGLSASGRPILEFAGRGSLVSDLVGEKLTEPFVDTCLEHVPGFRLLVPESRGNGYVLFAETGLPVDIDDVERRLCDNPQYAYARRLGQLEALRLMPVSRLFDRYAQAHVEQGVRLGDVKPAALRNERDWVARLRH